MENPNLVTDFTDVMNFIKQQERTIKELKEKIKLLEEENKKSIAVIAPAFSSDCIETLEEINEEIKESFEEAGGEEFTYIPCLNDNNAHISALSSLIEKNLSGWID